MRLAIRVKPNFAHTLVGGAHHGELIVRVTERAHDDAATGAAVKAVAEALGLRPYEVHLVSGATSRTKVVEVPDGLEERVDALLHG